MLTLQSNILSQEAKPQRPRLGNHNEDTRPNAGQAFDPLSLNGKLCRLNRSFHNVANQIRC